jgi:hypothetical protein
MKSPIIAFAWTSPALIARAKDTTRRDWTADYAKRWKAGQIAQAYDNGPRRGGKKIGEIRLTQAPHLERTRFMPDADYRREGLEWLDRHPQCIPANRHIDFQAWKEADERLYVICFEILAIEPWAEEWLSELLETA